MTTAYPSIDIDKSKVHVDNSVNAAYIRKHNPRAKGHRNQVDRGTDSLRNDCKRIAHVTGSVDLSKGHTLLSMGDHFEELKKGHEDGKESRILSSNMEVKNE